MRVLLIDNGKVAGEFFGQSVEELTANNPGAVFVGYSGNLARVIGMDYAAGVLSGEPTPEPAPAPGLRHITKLAFRNRFTQAEKVTMEIAALDNPAATMPQRQQAAALRANLADTAAATFIDLQRADTRTGVLSLEAAGLLAAGRALEILDTPIQPGERPL